MTVRFNVVKTDWRFGEISDDYQANFNDDVVQAAAKEMLNFVPLRSGGVTRRPSTELLTAWQASALDNAKLVPFQKPNGDFVIISLTENGANIDVDIIDLTTGAITSEGSLDFNLDPSNTARDLSCVQAGDSLFIAGGESSDYPVRIRWDRNTADFKLEGNSTSTDGGLDWYKELGGLWGLDSAAPTALVGVPDTGCAIDDEAFGATQRILLGSQPATVNATPGRESATLAASFSPSFDNTKVAIHVDDVNFFGDVPVDFTGASVLAWHQNRLVMANFQKQTLLDHPTFITFSASGNPFIILAGLALPGVGAPDDSPISQVLFQKDAAQINWMLSVQSTLYVGMGDKIIAYPQEQLFPRTALPTSAVSANVNPDIDPIQDNERLIYVGANAGAIWAVQFDDILKSYSPTELTQFAHHLTRDVNEVAINYPDPEDPVKRLYARKKDESIIVGSFISNDIRVPPAWSRIEFGQLQSNFIRIQQLLTVGNDLYALVLRTSDGDHAVIKFVPEEKADFTLDFQEAISVGGPTSWTTTNDLLHNQEVFVAVYDSSNELIAVETQTVSGAGVITTETSGDNIVIGIPFESTLKPFVFQTIDNEGPTDNRMRRVRKVRLFVRESRLAVLNGEPLLPDVPSTPGGVLSEKTGSFERTRIKWDEEPGITIQAVSGYNLTVLQMSQEIEV